MTDRRVRATPVALRAAGGFAVFCAAAGTLVGFVADLPNARADDGAIPVVSVDPESLLITSTGNLSYAEAALGQASLPAEFQGLIASQDQLVSNGLELITQYESTQALLLGSTEIATADLANLAFFGVDQQIEQASASVLNAVIAFDASPSTSTEFAAFDADLQFFNAAFVEALVPDTAARAFDASFAVGSTDIPATLLPGLATILALHT